MNIETFAGRFPIGARIGTGFFLILGVLLALAWIGYRTTIEARSDFGKFSSISANSIRVISVDAQFTEVRRQVRLYADEGESKALDKIHKLNEEIDGGLDKAIQLTLDSERKQSLEKVRTDISLYMKDLDQLVTLREKREKLVAEGMNPVGQKAREYLTEIMRTASADGDFEAAAMAGAVQEKLLLGRLAAIKFIATDDPAMLDKAREELTKYTEMAGKLHEKLQNPTRKQLAED